MNKQNILFLIIGSLLGLIIGFVAANQLNRGANYNTTATVSSPMNQDAAMPQVTAALEKAEKEPNNFDAQVTVGQMFLRIKNVDKALPYLLKAQQLKPDDYETIVLLGNTYFFLDKFDEAEIWYLKALDKNPNDVSVRTDLGLTFVMREPKNLKRAIEEYEKSLKIDPRHELTLQNYSVALKENGETDKLKDILKRLEEVNPQNRALLKLKENQ